MPFHMLSSKLNWLSEILYYRESGRSLVPALSAFPDNGTIGTSEV